ncbi:MAG: YfcE family phosphodiesterase [Treponema sp.]|nr:YfcE family phosphodiesterase [Treponema sp.]
MIEITQRHQNIIGSKAAISALETKDHARLLIISDSHENYPVFEKIVRRYGAKCDAVVFCGDGICDISRLLYAAQTDSKLMECVPPVIAAVKGNCDPSSYPLDSASLYFSELVELKVNGQIIMISHGHNQSVDFGLETFGLEMQVSESRIGFYGHTHIAREDNINGYKMVNPGSCARPRGGQPASFAIATVEKTFTDIAFIRMKIESDGSTSFNLWNPI